MSFGQNPETEKLINEGIVFHDQGDYPSAIQKYEEALKIDPESEAALYEMALTYFKLNDYKMTLSCAKKVLSLNKNHEDAYVVSGSAYDQGGKPKKAIKVYKKGLKGNPESYLLYFNMGISYLGINEYEKAEKSAIAALEINNSHSSSHLLLANIHYLKYNRVRSMLACYFFLLLEPNSARSAKALTMLKEQMNEGVKKTSDTIINVNLQSEDKEFQAAELMLSMLSVSRLQDESQQKTEMELFTETNSSLFRILGDLKTEKNTDFWWDFYVSILFKLNEAGHTETFSFYISQSEESDEISDWFEKNPEKFENFKTWLKN